MIGAAAGPSGERKFWRWVKAVKDGVGLDRTKPHLGRTAAATHSRWASEAAACAEELPVPPSPPYLRRTGGAGLQKLQDFAALIQEVLRDVEAVREAAIEPASDDSPTKVVDGKLLLQAGKQKLDVAAAGLRLWREVQQLMENERLYEGIYRVLHEELAFAPDARARVFEQLDELFSPASAVHSGALQ